MRRRPVVLPALAALCALLLAAAAAAMEAPSLERTVTERPFQIVVDRRACGPEGIHVQVLGAGGPELGAAQAGSGYLVWVDGRARVMIDTGPGTALRYDESGAAFPDLLALAFTQLELTHSSGLPALLRGTRDAGRTDPLPVYGPSGSELVPGLNDWTSLLFGPKGAYRHLADFLSPLSAGGYEVVPYQIDAFGRRRWTGFRRDGISLSAIPTDHGPVPALAWRVDVDGVGITFAGDTANRWQTVAELAEGSVILVASHMIPENARGAPRERHMPPSQIGKIAAAADVNLVILGQRGERTRGRESASRDLIQEHFRGPVVFANDLECWET